MSNQESKPEYIVNGACSGRLDATQENLSAEPRSRSCVWCGHYWRVPPDSPICDIDGAIILDARAAEDCEHYHNDLKEKEVHPVSALVNKLEEVLSEEELLQLQNFLDTEDVLFYELISAVCRVRRPDLFNNIGGTEDESK